MYAGRRTAAKLARQYGDGRDTRVARTEGHSSMTRIAALAAVAALVAAPAFAQTAATTTKTTAAPAAASSKMETKTTTKGPHGKTMHHKKVTKKADADGSKTTTTVENKTK